MLTATQPITHGFELLTPYLISQHTTHLGLHTATDAFVLQAPVTEPQPIGATREIIEKCSRIKMYERKHVEEEEGTVVVVVALLLVG